MTKKVQLRHGPGYVAEYYNGLPGELTATSSDWELRVHDGVIPGGRRVLSAVPSTIFQMVANSSYLDGEYYDAETDSTIPMDFDQNAWLRPHFSSTQFNHGDTEQLPFNEDVEDGYGKVIQRHDSNVFPLKHDPNVSESGGHFMIGQAGWRQADPKIFPAHGVKEWYTGYESSPREIRENVGAVYRVDVHTQFYIEEDSILQEGHIAFGSELEILDDAQLYEIDYDDSARNTGASWILTPRSFDRMRDDPKRSANAHTRFLPIPDNDPLNDLASSKSFLKELRTKVAWTDTYYLTVLNFVAFKLNFSLNAPGQPGLRIAMDEFGSTVAITHQYDLIETSSSNEAGTAW